MDLLIAYIIYSGILLSIVILGFCLWDRHKDCKIDDGFIDSSNWAIAFRVLKERQKEDRQKVVNK